MKIAFISYEYPPDTAYGGIATYIHQAARMMYQRGHHVEVFTSSSNRCATENEDGIVTHRIDENDRQIFPERIGKIFAERHRAVEFDVIEGPELSGDAREAVRLFPDIPLVVKLHTPSFFIYQLNGYGVPFLTKVRREIGAIRRGLSDRRYWFYNPKNDIECSHTLDADDITTPCKDLGNRAIEAWGLDAEKVSLVPNPYTPMEKILKISTDTQTNIVTYIGRLEIRKGILDLARAIPLILQQKPNTKFRLVGRPDMSPKAGFSDMRKYLEHKLRDYTQSIEFTGAVPPDGIPSVLANTDICVFPSLWENFPNVCLEAMAAARGVIGSSAGGMAEMLDNGKVGRLVPPRSPQKIAAAAIELLENPALRISLGQAARDRLLSEYNLDRIGTLQEASYSRAIARRRSIGSRHISA
ncbi:MAG TPA: glycosyltransferase family 4 protein [Leptolyngbyaceae cyanobacterium]